MEIIYKLDEPGDRDLFNGIQEINKNDYKEALKHFEKGSNYDNEYASLFTAIIYLTGFDLPKQYPEKAMKLLEKIASEWKNRVAQYLIAVMYDQGDEGVKQNKTASAHWYLLSASNGWMFSIGNVGFAYTYSRGVMENHKKAIEWMNKVLKYENSDAKKKDSEILYLFGNIKFELILTKADQSTVAHVCKLTQSGMASPVEVFNEFNYKNPSWAKIVRILIWDILSNKKSGAITSCQSYMADIYLSGKYKIPRDDEKAMRWQIKAGNSGNSRCCLNMGFQYEIGTYLKQYYKEAMRW